MECNMLTDKNHIFSIARTYILPRLKYTGNAVHTLKTIFHCNTNYQ